MRHGLQVVNTTPLTTTPPLACRVLHSVATVFKAVCIATNTKVIVKAYYKSKMHPKHYHKLHREIEAMKCLNGPYVTEFYAHFEDAQCVYIVMEFCEGGDLFKTMLMHGGLLDEQWVCIEVRVLPCMTLCCECVLTMMWWAAPCADSAPRPERQLMSMQFMKYSKCATPTSAHTTYTLCARRTNR